VKTPEWLKEIREWLGTIALIVLAVLAIVFIPDYMRRSNKELEERKALLKYIRETTPEEHLERLRKAAKKKTPNERAAPVPADN
jgi:hypothetical protein